MPVNAGSKLKMFRTDARETGAACLKGQPFFLLKGIETSWKSTGSKLKMFRTDAKETGAACLKGQPFLFNGLGLQKVFSSQDGLNRFADKPEIAEFEIVRMVIFF